MADEDGLTPPGTCRVRIVAQIIIDHHSRAPSAGRPRKSRADRCAATLNLLLSASASIDMACCSRANTASGGRLLVRNRTLLAGAPTPGESRAG
jgi:hypothetical protein